MLSMYVLIVPNLFHQCLLLIVSVGQYDADVSRTTGAAEVQEDFMLTLNLRCITQLTGS